jgi:hypothetical protein
MRQTTLSMTLEVKPESTATLSALIDGLHDGEAMTGPAQSDFAWFLKDVPSLHFLSISVFPSGEYDPLFVIEANFDGVPGVFWGQLEAAIGPVLRDALRCCKKPLDEDGPLYEAVTRADSRAPIAPYLEARTNPPSVFHHGNRGLTRDRILAEGELFKAIRKELKCVNDGGSNPYRSIDVVDIHADLRAAMLPKFAWLDEKAPARIPFLERVSDLARLTAFVFAVVFALSLPGVILAPAMSTVRFLVVLAIVLLVIAVPLWLKRKALPGTKVESTTSLPKIILRYSPWVILFVLVYLAVVGPIVTTIGALLTGGAWQDEWRNVIRAMLLGLLSAVFFSVPGILLWLRYLERRDSSHDAPPIDEEVVRQMAQREDWIAQSHMGSIVLLKPGILRTIIVHAGHLGLGLVLRVVATDGYLGSMRTVHFAHWAFVNNGSRLMFFSNFDQSWESYLDDFIEKAHVGLTLAWGCGTGFPPTRFLINDGASHGRKFKAWARHSMAISRFWYSAYGDFTVDQIERQNRIANGLRKPALSKKDAAAWINDL